jgi:hypothetical protein
MTLDELCVLDFYGDPLLSQARDLKLDQTLASIEAFDSRYRVEWKDTWIELSALSCCALLIHEFWTLDSNMENHE